MDSPLCVVHLRNIFYLIWNLWILLSVLYISETCFTWSAIYRFYSLCRTSQKHFLLDLQSIDSSLCVVHLRNIFYLICNLWILLSVSYISETCFTWSGIYGFYSLCRTSQKHVLLDLQSMDSSLCVVHLRNMFYLIWNLWILLSVLYISETCFTWSAIYRFFSLCRTSQKHVLLDLESMDSTLCVVHFRNMFYLICNL